MAIVMLTSSLSGPVFLIACLFTLIGIVAVLKEGSGRRLAAALLLALVLASPAVLHAGVIITGRCELFPWLIECWCPWCV